MLHQNSTLAWSLRSNPPEAEALGTRDLGATRSVRWAAIEERKMRIEEANGCPSTVKFCWACALLLCSGCGPDEIETEYGRRRGPGAKTSVNGTAVLADMFRASGARVSTWRRLSPKLESADTIVWIPDDFTPPTDEQQEFLEDWLWAGVDRTLVYVGRDYDGATRYWEQVRTTAPPEQEMELARRQAMAQSEFDAARAMIPREEDCGWFKLRAATQRQTVRALNGPWSDGVDAAKADLEITSLLEPPDDVGEVTTLLAAESDPLVFQLQDERWDTGKVVVVANGSFLLNLALVNHEHRKLAGRLIALCAPAKRVVLLESGAGGPSIVARDGDSDRQTGFEIFTVWPLGFVMLHLAIVGITLCIASFPIFGRPRELTSASTSDFGQHVAALGDLLAKTRDRQYAIDRLKEYEEQVRGEPSAQNS